MKQYTLDPYYQESLYLKTLEQPKSAHADAAIYNLTQAEADKLRSSYLKAQKKQASDLMKKCHIAWTKNPNWLSEEMFVTAKKAYDQASSKLWFYEHRDNASGKNETFDIPALKAIPLNRIVDIQSNGFFKLRDEKTPSVSWHKKTNTWHDFGNDTYGDNIDLVMKLDNCDFVTACKKLTTMI